MKYYNFVVSDMSIGNGNIESSVEGNKVNQKIPLSEHKTLFFDGGPSFFRVDKINPDLICKLRLTTAAISGFKHDYQKDEMTPKEFVLIGQSDNKNGVEIRITEEMCEKMLNYIREEKKKVYCFEGCP